MDIEGRFVSGRRASMSLDLSVEFDSNQNKLIIDIKKKTWLGYNISHNMSRDIVCRDSVSAIILISIY